MMTSDSLLMLTQDFGQWTTDPSRPDYASPAYISMAPRWQLVQDLRDGTTAIRAKSTFYLPRFEVETPVDYAARVNMTFVADHYSTTIVEHVGLVFAVPPKLSDDVADQIREILEDVDGEGNHFDVFLQSSFDDALHLGHCVLYTDYPVSDDIKNRQDEKVAQVRPYVIRYKASDIMSWRTATVGGVKILAQIVFRETGTEGDGEFGTKECVRYREITQQVFYDEFTGRATGVGAITWRAWKREAATEGNAGESFTSIGSGEIVGPDRIPARVVYGGQRIGYLESIPHLMGLAFSNIEETQVMSDYASIMHKCNVPTPIFIGRNVRGDGTDATVQMGQGIDIPLGGDAKMLEPTGVAIGATRQRIQDLRAEMRRQGATTDDATGKIMTAAEANLYAKQRNAKLSRAARSMQDASEGVLADIAAFLNKANTQTVLEGGSIAINQDFAGQGIDPAYLTVLVSAYKEGALPLDALLYALEKGRLPEDFTAEDSAIKLIAEESARQDAAIALAAAAKDAEKAKQTETQLPEAP